jgi:hypothetical protein
MYRMVTSLCCGLTIFTAADPFYRFHSNPVRPMMAMKMPLRCDLAWFESRGLSPRRFEWRQSTAPRSQNAAQNRVLSPPHRGIEAAT